MQYSSGGYLFNWATECTRSFVLCLKRKHKLFTLSSTKLDLHSQMPAMEIILQTFLVRFILSSMVSHNFVLRPNGKETKIWRQTLSAVPPLRCFLHLQCPPMQQTNVRWMDGHQVETWTGGEAWCCTKAKATTGAFPTCSSHWIQPRQQKSCLNSGANLQKWHLSSYWSLLFRLLYKTFFPTPKIMSEISLGNEQVF